MNLSEPTVKQAAQNDYIVFAHLTTRRATVLAGDAALAREALARVKDPNQLVALHVRSNLDLPALEAALEMSLPAAERLFDQHARDTVQGRLNDQAAMELRSGLVAYWTGMLIELAELGEVVA